MLLEVDPVDQGQIVEVAYGWHNGRLYLRIVDLSDAPGAPTRWYVADKEESDSPLLQEHEIANGRPPVRKWTACDDPDP